RGTIMRLEDPNRPKIGTWPRLIDEEGRGRQAVPSLSVIWRGEKFDVFCWLEVASNTFRDFHIEIDTLDNLFKEYAEDPEKVLERYFNWKPPKVSTAPVKRKITGLSLDDLDFSFD